MSSKERPIIQLDRLAVRYESFSEAQKAKDELSDDFIDEAIGGRLSVGGNRSLFLKTYLDQLEPTKKDLDVISSPERIADIYKSTTEMIVRNLKFTILRNEDPVNAHARREELRKIKNNYVENLKGEMPRVAEEISEWCRGSGKFPARAMEYHGLLVPEAEDKKVKNDVLDAGSPGLADLRSNFKIQRQFSGSFIMAYSDARVEEKISGKDLNLERRIYLNPDIEAVPEIFEKILKSANEAGISLQLKMYQRAPELASAHRKMAGGENIGGLRGDGVVIYVKKEDADTVLGMALAISKDNPTAFVGRETSRVPFAVADGIAIGDEPSQVRGESLTSHRAKIIEYALSETLKSGKSGAEVRDLFRYLLRKIAVQQKVNPQNLAFNSF